MKRFKLLTTILLATLLLSGCVFNKKEAIMTINSATITQADYDTAMKAYTKGNDYAQLSPEMKKDPNSYVNLMLKDRVINELIIKTLLNQEIEKKNITVTDKDINDEIVNITDKVGSKEKFNQILKENKVSLADFKKDVGEDLKIKKLIDTLSVVKVSEKDAEKFYKANIKQFQYPDKVRASHILILADENSIKEAIKAKDKKLTDAQVQAKVQEELNQKLIKAKELLAKVKQDPTQFAKIAKESSEDTISAKEGGDLGFFSREEMIGPFAQAAFSQKPNVVGEIVRTDYGYHIIMVTDRKQAGVEPFNKVKDELIAYLENQKKVEVVQGLIESLKNKADIKFVKDEYNPQKIQAQLKELTEKHPAFSPQNSEEEE